jgi:hypothetical protein
MFTFKSPSAEWKVEQLSIAKPPLYCFLKYSRFKANIFSATPAKATIFGPTGISVKTNPLNEIAIPIVEKIDTSTRRKIQSAFLLFE